MAEGLKLLGLHIRDTKNAGDRWSSPLEYFEFPGHEVILGDMRSPPDCNPDVVIYGGGSITASPDFQKRGLTIGWGVGHHERHEPWDGAMQTEHERAAQLCDLYFPRDEVGMQTTPCASCLHPIFDEPFEPVHAVVRYSAARRISVNEPGVPHMTNEDGTIGEAVRFLASGREVITSSYHGAYWAHLLGRKVTVVPWGSKFSYLPTGDLEQCREANQRAYQQVIGALHG